MNEELKGILSLLGVQGLDEPAAWKRVAMVHNFTAVPPRPGALPLGFKLIVMDRRGDPEWFGRCCWAPPEAMRRETLVLEALTRDPLGRRHVPEIRTASSPRITVQLSRHLGVRPYSATVESRGPRRWAAEVTEALEVGRDLMARAASLVPEIRTQRTVEERQRSLFADLALVRSEGISSAAIDRLAAALDVVRAVPFSLQHGDLWPANLLRREGRWWLIDFAECGLVWVPLYDVLHMLHTAPSGARDPWYGIEREPAPATWAAERRAIARRFAREAGLTSEQAGACLVYYLVHLAAYRLRPGVPRIWSRELLASLERIGGFLAASGSLSRLLPLTASDQAP